MGPVCLLFRAGAKKFTEKQEEEVCPKSASRAGAIRCANRAGAAMRPRACETRAIQGPGASRERKEAYAGSEQGLYAIGMRIMTKHGTP